jgi:predicted cupin superfamily sugar epimerase
VAELDKTSADQIIARLNLEPHPEGGHFRETFRDAEGPHGRAHSTAILYLLRSGERSHWHRVDAAETWHWYGGGVLKLTVHEDGDSTEIRLGPDWDKGEVPQAVVPAHAWQKAEPESAWVLLGCTVAPGFDFAGFELAPEGWEP